jgi:hypothetical protein
MSLVSETVYLGRDNQIELVLLEDDNAIGDHTSITRATLFFGVGDSLLSPDPFLTIDSSTDSAYFDFTDPSKLILKLGAADLPKGRHHVRLVIYTAGLPNGASWEPGLMITVK